MKPKDFIAENGLSYFESNKNKKITIRLLSDDGLVYRGFFVGITPVGNELPLISGLLIYVPQYVIHMLYNDVEDGHIIPVKINLTLVDSMDDIVFSEFPE